MRDLIWKNMEKDDANLKMAAENNRKNTRWNK